MTNLAIIIVDGLGGPNAVARIFDIAPPSVCEWKSKGKIPPARMAYLTDVPKYRERLIELGVVKEHSKTTAWNPLAPRKRKKKRKVKAKKRVKPTWGNHGRE